jgi:hypothetical protein
LKYLFFIIVILYCVLYAPYGLNDCDDGFILSQSWRMYNGEIPYKDFMTIRPFFTPFIHSVFLHIVPDNYQVIFERYLFYVLMALSSLFCSLSIYKGYKVVNPYLLASLGFVISVGSFPPMAWHTVDGIFFASIAFYFLTLGYTDLFLPFLLLSALCKQSFYPLILVGIYFVYFVFSLDKENIYWLIGELLILVISFFTLLFYSGLLPNFIEQTTRSSGVIPVILSYFKPSLHRILFLFSLAVYLYKRELLLLSLLSISFCAGISWGYPTPALFSVPLIFSFFLLIGAKNKPIAVFFLIISVVHFWFEYQKPYLNPNREELKYSLSETYPKLTGIKVSGDTKEKYEELYKLTEKYNPFVVMPEIPQIYYLLDKRNPVSVDWIFNAEVPNEERLMNELKLKKPFVIIQKYPQIIAIKDSTNKSSSKIAYKITKEWWKIEETKYFNIYRK